MRNTSGWFLPWKEIDSYDGVTLEKQPLGQYRVRVYSDLTEHHKYYFDICSDAHECYKRCKDSIRFEKTFISKIL